MEVRKTNAVGKVIFKEGDPNDFLAIVKQGEFEIVKQDLRQVYFNSKSGAVSIESKDKSWSIKSSRQPELVFINPYQRSGQNQYTGSKLQL